MARLAPFAPEVWIADGPEVSFLSFPYPTRMAVVRLPDGLWVWSPVALDDGLRAEIDALGPVRWLVEPNRLHHLFLPEWLDAWPEAVAFAPPGLARRKPEVAFAGELSDEPEPAWARWIDQAVLRAPALPEVVFFHRPSSTCFVGDFIQRFDPDALHGFRRWVMAADGLVGEHGSTPREIRATAVRRGEVRRALDRIRGWGPERLVIAHGACATEAAGQVIEDGLGWIERPWPL